MLRRLLLINNRQKTRLLYQMLDRMWWTLESLTTSASLLFEISTISTLV